MFLNRYNLSISSQLPDSSGFKLARRGKLFMMFGVYFHLVIHDEGIVLYCGEGKYVAVGTRTIKILYFLKKAFFSILDILIDLWS